ncbi:hypothetical protein CYLTODRAFT_418407 [Cylindrobasidium torrendii FP15055 ss-10]|uniref:Uncharacterized protein n=1 Tax=Cylindrobasidium torrendii FP15055 ss-10 TaxID=1314674 RepID=A0A0D7BQH5_9AGAR|nr:hypothetical protein CYLTODRAFT_418407 [Cylindrobasidium torrendii FP15055 ss-10]
MSRSVTSSTVSYDSSFMYFDYPTDGQAFHQAPRSVRGSSVARSFERQVVVAWKKVTRMTKKQPRASYLPPNFVFVTPHQRRSIRYTTSTVRPY